MNNQTLEQFLVKEEIENYEWLAGDYLAEQFDPEMYHDLESSGIVQSMNGDPETIGIIYENYTLQIRMNSINEIIEPSGQEAKTNTEEIEISLLMNSENKHIENQEIIA